MQSLLDEEGMYTVNGDPQGEPDKTKRVDKDNIDIPFLTINWENHAALTRIQEHLRNEKVNMHKVHKDRPYIPQIDEDEPEAQDSKAEASQAGETLLEERSEDCL